MKKLILGLVSMRIAIVGAGISGLAAAYFLHKHHEVTVFEANHYLGGHTSTVEVPSENGSLAIDTGFIVYNHRTYPLFCKLLAAIGVDGQPTTMSFSMRCDATGLEYRGADLNGFFAQRKNLLSWKFYRFLTDLLRFNRVGLEFLKQSEDLTVKEFFQRESFSPIFREKYFFPMASAVWSCPTGKIESFPIRFILEFYHHHGLLSVHKRPQWMVVRGGSASYLSPLTAGFRDRIHLNCPIRSVIRSANRVKLHLASGGTLEFDHLIFACHSDQALRILADSATATEHELLSAFPYEANETVLHTDTSVLPRTKRAWACWNYFLPSASVEKATVTYNMNMLQNLRAKETYCVTLNRTETIDPAKIIRKFNYHHPVFTMNRRAAHRRYAELLGPNRTSYCGAYWRNGFHEDGVYSALMACRGLMKQEESWNHAFTRAACDINVTPPSSMSFNTNSP
jgi:predicted NAD/FAD-binding protein